MINKLKHQILDIILDAVALTILAALNLFARMEKVLSKIL